MTKSSWRIGLRLWMAVAAVLVGTAALSYAAPTLTKGQRKPASRKLSHRKHSSRKSAANWRKHGQQNIDSQRARDIQEALIRNHYMSGEATGKWDATSQQAMEKFQADNGWQKKVTPDSRALIKLGLGPDHQHLLNPESAMTTTPAEPSSAAPAPASASVAPSSSN